MNGGCNSVLEKWRSEELSRERDVTKGDQIEGLLIEEGKNKEQENSMADSDEQKKRKKERNIQVL